MRLSGSRFVLLFHDTHHRLVTDPGTMAAFDLSGYDGVLRSGWCFAICPRAEPDPTRLRVARSRRHRGLSPICALRPSPQRSGVHWELGRRRAAERARRVLLFTRRRSRLFGNGPRCEISPRARQSFKDAGIEYAGWLPNFEVPRTFSRHRVAIHVPRRPYAQSLPGIPTIRVFEALACGIPLVCSPWSDAEHLFTPGEDFLVAETGPAMKRHLALLLADADYARKLAARGRETILARHTCCPSRDRAPLDPWPSLRAPHVADGSQPAARCAS